MVAKRRTNDAEKFLDVMRADKSVREAIDNAIDDSIFTLAVAIGAQRGLKFRRADLEAAIAARLRLGDFKLGDAASGPGQCNSSSGTRTPCVYCNSKRPSIDDILERVIPKSGQF
ncbi:MAG TPA: hypothetical protein VF782_05785 [Allosphingosinicella sp.]